MKKIDAHCQSSHTAIYSQLSQQIFKKILKEIYGDNNEKLLDIYAKIKSGNTITQQEYQELSVFIYGEDFKDAYEKIVERFLTIGENKKGVFRFEAIETELEILLHQSLVIGILENKNENEEIKHLTKYFIKTNIEQKEYFYEIIEKYSDHYLVKNIRSHQFELLTKHDNNRSILSSKIPLKISNIAQNKQLPEGFLFAHVNMKNKNNYLIYNGMAQQISKKSEIYEGKYAVYVIDVIKNKLLQINKDTLSSTTRDFSNIDFLKIGGGVILSFLGPIEYSWNNNDTNEKEHTITDGNISLYSVEKNKNIIDNIHLKYNKEVGNMLYGLSSDETIFYSINFENGEIIEEEVVNITGSQEFGNTEELWNYLLNK